MTRQHRWQLRQKEKGRCRVCGKPRGKSKQYCDKHLLADAQRHRNRREQTHAAGQQET